MPEPRPFFQRLLDFARTLQPDIAFVLMRAIRELANSYKESAVAEALARGAVDEAASIVVSDTIAQIAMLPVQASVRDAMIRSAIYFFQDTPKGAPPAGQLTGVVRFNALDANVIRAARAFESPLLDTLATDLRAGVKSVMQDQLARGINPRTAARALRGLVGVTDQQVTALANYRSELESLSKGALDRKLTDGRIDRTVAAAIKRGKPLATEQIDRAVDAYATNLKAQNAETLTRTASLNAMKEGQRLAWKQAIAAGKVAASDLIDTWHTTMDGRERPAHHEMHLKTKRFDEPWIVPGIGPQDYPGQDEYNCRCVVFTRPRIRRASELAVGSSAA